MKVNPAKTVVVCNGTQTKQKLWQVWRAGRLPPVKLTARDLGANSTDTQWASWRNPVQKKRISTFPHSMSRVRVLGLPAHRSACAWEGASLRRSASSELMVHGGPTGDPQVSADLSTVRDWAPEAVGWSSCVAA
eukprot:4075439-Amphidinium_carterae.2